MRRFLLPALTLCAALLATAPAQAQAARYEIDPDHLTVAFLVDHIGYAKVLGMFRSARGSYRFDEATATLSEVRIEVETASVFSNQRKRDDHLKGPDFLNSGEFPRMVFTAAAARRTRMLAACSTARTGQSPSRASRALSSHSTACSNSMASPCAKRASPPCW